MTSPDSGGLESWFSPQIEYSGWGKAEFEDPKGYIEGPIEVTVDDSCHISIEMKIDTCKSDQDLRFGLIEFLSNDKPYEKDGQLVFSGMPGTNPCLRLDINCADGNFITFERIFYNPIGTSIFGDIGENSKIQFFLPDSEFLLQLDEQPKFWVIPLVNYVGDFQEINHGFIGHPLRLRETPYPLITFEFRGRQGFIEPLLDFGERKKQLITGKSQRLITALMVGEVGEIDFGIENFREELPFEFLALLDLATGSEIGVAWIELRGETGNLIKRLHSKFHKPSFSKGHPVIPEVGADEARYALKHLLNQAQSSDYFGKAPLGPVIADLVESGLHSLSIEDTFNRVCRGLDYLCEHFNLDTQNLMNELDPETQILVKNQLQNASRNIRNIAESASDTVQKKVIERISSKTTNAANIDRSFGLAVAALLDRFGLPDAEIVDNHYSIHPRRDGRKSWSAVISHYRGMSVHTGYFELGSVPGQYDIQDLMRVAFHLRDILIRIVLKMLNYDYVYYPPVIWRRLTQMPVDWVTNSTSASELGY